MMRDHRERLGQALSGRYRLEQEVGAGGMATVYLAHDVRHDRRVAIKVLRPELSAIIGAERFLSEIRTTANLQHPHILALFDSGEVDGTVFYVMPYVEGESLRDRLNREKQLPVPEAVRIASEVASALDYAHRRGVIHRDIKPENILLHDGQALVADFGIALAATGSGDSRMTETGISLGTPTYMSPEQATGGRHLDARTDVYALGCVLYEMLAGEAPFTGPTPQSVVARVMTDEPRRLTDHRKTVPAHVDAAVRRALQKLPADRFASAREFADALLQPDSGALASAEPVTTGRYSTRWLRTSAFVVVAAAVAALLGWLAGRRAAGPHQEDATPSRLAMLAPALGGTGVGGTNRTLTLTADGSRVVYVAAVSDRSLSGLQVQRLDAEQPSVVAGSDLTYAPSVSPDGRWIAVRNLGGDVMRLPMAGTQQTPVPIARGFAFYAWHPDGSLWITRTPYRAIERLASGSDTLEVVRGDLALGIGLQQILDDGRSALAIETISGNASGPCVLLDLQTWERKTLLSTPTVSVRYTSGYLVYAVPDGTLLAAPFDPRTGHLGTGNPVTIASGVSTTGTGDAQFDVARNGTLAYVPEAPRSLVFVDRRGTERLAVDEHHNFHMPRFSPDGRRLSLDFVSPSGRDVWILDLEQKTLTRTTFDRDGHDATWSPDGRALIYASSRTGDYGIYSVRPGTGAPAEALLASSKLGFTGLWLPDGKRLVTVAADLRDASAQDIALVGNGGKGPMEPLVATPFRENFPALSRDGRWLAFVSDQSGRTEVYVRSLEESSEIRQISQGGGDEPVWSPDGREVFYRSYTEGEPHLAAARIETTPVVRVTERQNLFPAGSYLNTTPHSNYDISPDGRTFVFVRRNPASRIVIVQNLPALVRRGG